MNRKKITKGSFAILIEVLSILLSDTGIILFKKLFNVSNKFVRCCGWGKSFNWNTVFIN